MKQKTIEEHLVTKGCWLDGVSTSMDVARARSHVTRQIAAAFPSFERLRDLVLGQPCKLNFNFDTASLKSALVACGILLRSEIGDLSPSSAEARRYLSGGWLEEYAGLAADEAGADEVLIGQRIGWQANGFRGINEIDVLARFGECIVFMSAKALRSKLDVADARHREKLMAALQEADNIVDHFGDAKSLVILLVTTDLWDEGMRSPRYEQLHGKAAALGVDLVTLDSMCWSSLIGRLRTSCSIINCQ